MERTKKIQWEKIIKKLQEDDPVHGLPHIERVLRCFDLLKKSNQDHFSPILDALEWAVYLHDIGRVNKSLDHGAESVLILNKYYKEEFPEDVNMREEICYAIENHQDFFDLKQRIQNKDKKNLLLSLLILLDCTDVIGEAGINRTTRATKIPLAPECEDLEKEEKIERVKELLNDYTKREEKDREIMKNSSILEHITYNYAFACQVRDCVESYLSDFIKKEIEKRLDFSRKFGTYLLELVIWPRHIVGDSQDTSVFPLKALVSGQYF